MRRTDVVLAIALFLGSGPLSAQRYIFPPDKSVTVKKDPWQAWLDRLEEQERQAQQHRHEKEMLSMALTAQQEPKCPEQQRTSILPVVDNDFNYTGPHANGRFWKSMPVEYQVIYLIAMADGITSSSMSLRGHDCQCSYAEMVEGLTQFYDSDVAFGAIPIWYAHRLFAQRMRGESLESIAAQARAFLRAKASGQ